MRHFPHLVRSVDPAAQHRAFLSWAAGSLVVAPYSGTLGCTVRVRFCTVVLSYLSCITRNASGDKATFQCTKDSMERLGRWTLLRSKAQRNAARCEGMNTFGDFLGSECLKAIRIRDTTLRSCALLRGSRLALALSPRTGQRVPARCSDQGEKTPGKRRLSQH